MVQASANRSSENMTPVYFGAGDVDLEKGNRQPAGHIERMITPGGHPVDFSQPAIPVQHRKYGNPIPVGLTSYGLGFLLVGLFTLQARGVKNPSVALPTFILFMGVTQTLVGWFEMFIGNTYSATIFIAFAGFCMSYTGIYLPAFGVITSYTDPVTKELSPEFDQAVGLFFSAWAVVILLFLLASFRSSVAIIGALTSAFLAFVCLAIDRMIPSNGVNTAAGVFCILASFHGFWGAMSGYWTPDTTFRFIHVSPIDLSPKDE